jgi:hypothetical protein
MTVKPGTAAAILPLLLAHPANAAIILSSNFDSITSATLTRQRYGQFTAADGWKGGKAGIEIQTRNVAGKAFSGDSFVELDTFANSSMFIDLAPGRYQISYYYSPRPGIAAASNGIDLLLNGNLLDSVTGTGGAQTQWQQRNVDFRARTGGILAFAATGKSDGLGGYLDSITLSAATVPEPESWALMIIGFGFIGAAMRQRQRLAVAMKAAV